MQSQNSINEKSWQMCCFVKYWYQVFYCILLFGMALLLSTLLDSFVRCLAYLCKCWWKILVMGTESLSTQISFAFCFSLSFSVSLTQLSCKTPLTIRPLPLMFCCSYQCAVLSHARRDFVYLTSQIEHAVPTIWRQWLDVGAPFDLLFSNCY